MENNRLQKAHQHVKLVDDEKRSRGGHHGQLCLQDLSQRFVNQPGDVKTDFCLERSSHHKVEFDPFIKGQLASRN